VVPFRRQSRGMGCSEDRGHSCGRAVFEELRGDAGTVDLQFDFKEARFIFLWSGKYDSRSPSMWDADRPKYAEQITRLRQWLDDAKAEGIKKTFIVFHYPVF
jgi:hypothetical protein